MAVTTGTINVNSNQPNWTRAHVMDALETVFGSSHLNWNSGTQQTGVPVCCLYPGHDGTAATQDNLVTADSQEHRVFNGSGNWGRCGGAPVAVTTGGADSGHVDGKDGYSATRYLYVTNNSTTSYLVQDELIPASNGVDNSTDVITLTHRMGSNLTTETKLTYNGQGTNLITGLSSGQVVYMRRIGPNKITLHTSQAGARDNNSRVDLTSTSLSDAKRFRTDTAANPTITVKRGEKLYWYTHAMNQGNFRICDVTTTSGAYNAERVLSDSSKFIGTLVNSSYAITGQGTYADPWYWQTAYYPQTETEVYNPQKVSGTGHTGLHSYGYCNDAQSNLKGSVVLLPDYNYEMRASYAGDSHYMPYWKVTVSGSQGDTDNSGSGRTNIKLRVYRDTYSYDEGEVNSITIHNVATGWSAGDVFTIPGEDIGGSATTHDITFGTNAQGSGTNGTPSIIVTNHGAGNNMFQKHPSGDFSILRMENESGKTFGTTYWAFAIDDNNYNMYVKSGCAWQTLNSLGTNCDSTGSDEEQYGVFGGDAGLDVQASKAFIERTPYQSGSYDTYLRFATTSSPTNYPLKIRYYKAASPQDTNFAVIQFIQHINSVDEPFACFTLHRGSTFGASVWDLDHVWNGTYTEYKTQYQEQNNVTSGRDRWIDMKYWTPSHHVYNGQKPHHEPPDQYTLAREASYGYLRNGDGNTSRAYADVRYSPNIMTGHETDNDVAEVYTYYRDQTNDKTTSSDQSYGVIVNQDLENSVSSSAGYYKPIKGIPINNRFAPCPYYIPDDFVFIQVEVTPPATVFRPGDTITVAAGEVYTIINCDNQVDQNGIDGGSNNVAIGMLFAARTT